MCAIAKKEDTQCWYVFFCEYFSLFFYTNHCVYPLPSPTPLSHSPPSTFTPLYLLPALHHHTPIPMPGSEVAGSGSSRRLGNGYSLALKTGGSPGTHCTLVYFNNLKRGFAQTQVKQQAADYFASKGITSVAVTYGGDCFKRSVEVCGDLEQVSQDLLQLFGGYDIQKEQLLHVDLKGNAPDDLLRTVSTVDNWNI